MVTYTQLLEILRGRSGSGAKYGLERMQALLQALGHPEASFRSWLIAGTNGKGSTCAMLEAVARLAGERTGMNTSPHLNRTTERIRVDGVEVSQTEMVAAFEQVEGGRCRADLEATFFETVTAMAFCHFAARQVTLAVVEVGLGGRLDATNLLPCEASAVVSIGLDHTRILGETLAAIAREKACVARADRPLVIGRLLPEALDAVVEVARERGATPMLVADHWCSGSPPAVEHPAGRVELTPGLEGAHQVDNSAVAALVALEQGVPAAIVQQGLGQARWRGRLEDLSVNGRRYLIDSAHNLEGASALGTAVADRVRSGYALVIASTGTRNTGAFVERLAQQIGWPAEVRVCKPGGHRVADAAEVADRIRPLLPQSIDLAVCDSVAEALDGEPVAPVVLVAGSMFLAGEALSVLDREQRDPFVAGR